MKAKAKKVEQPSTSISSYSLLLKPNYFATNCLQKTWDLYIKGGHYFQNCSLNLLAAATPAQCEKVFPGYPEIAYFLSCFSLESSPVDGLPAIAQSDLPALFSKYWQSEGGGSYNVNLVKSMAEFQISDRFVFVDRKVAFNSWNKKIGFTSEDIELLFDTMPIPKKKADDDEQSSKDEASVKFWRTSYSNLWGTGLKTDKSAKRNSKETAIGIFANDRPNNSAEFRDLFMARLGAKDDQELKRIAGATTGAEPEEIKIALLEKIVEYDEEDCDKIAERLRAKLDKSSLEPSPTWDRFLSAAEKHLGLSFRGPRALRDEFAEMIGQGGAKIRSTRSNAMNQSLARYEGVKRWNSRDMSLQPCFDLLDELSKVMGKECNIDDYAIRPRQLSGLDEFFLHWQANEDLEVALSEAHEGKFAAPLFKKLAELHPEFRLAPPNVFDLIKACEELNSKMKYESLRLPGLRRISAENPILPRFGESRPRIRYKLESNTKRPTLERIELRLYDGIEFVDVSMLIQAKRLNKELFGLESVANGTNPCYRNHKFDRIQKGEPDCLMTNLLNAARQGKIGAELFIGGYWYPSEKPKWYLNISPRLEYTKLRKLVDVPRDAKLFAIDQGVRNPAAFALLQLSPTGKFSVEKGQTHFDVLKHGLIHHLEKNCDGEMHDVFYNTGNLAKKTEIDWANEIIGVVNPDWKIVDETISRLALLKNVVRNVFNSVRKYPGLIPACVIMDVVEKVSPSFTQSTAKRTYFHNSGSLTFSRVELLRKLKQLVRSYIDKVMIPAKAAEEEICRWELIVSRIQKKSSNLLKDFENKRASAYVEAAIRADADVIVLENLDPKPDKKKSKEFNRNISVWSAKRIQNQVKRMAPIYGINQTLIDPQGTSHRDVDGKPGVRWGEFNPADEKCVQKFKNLVSRLFKKKGQLSDIDNLYKEAYQQLGVSKPGDLSTMEKQLLPMKKGGKFFKSIIRELPLDADEAAAIQIGRKAVSYLAGTWERASSEVASKTQAPLAKRKPSPDKDLGDDARKKLVAKDVSLRGTRKGASKASRRKKLGGR